MHELSEDGQAVDVAIVGGGLAGLTAAAYLARADRQVLLLEKARTLGGRAQTQARDGYLFNLGPHALYQGSEAESILKELGISYTGGTPDASRAWALDQSSLYRLPGSPGSLLASRLLGFGDKLSLARILVRLMSAEAREFQHISAQQWLEENANSRLRRVLEAMMRFSTYVSGADRLSAAVFIRQMQLSARFGVCYLDGGWQTLVDGLVASAEDAGATLRTSVRVTGLEGGASGPALCLADGSRISTSAVILAVEPQVAAELLPGNEALQQRARRAQPVRAAVLDLALEQLPRPEYSLVIGIDRPLYLSVHSAVAGLAPGDGALVHLAEYLGPGDGGTGAEAELEEMMDITQPGWRQEVVTRRFLPDLKVVNRIVTPGEGFDGRPPVQAMDRPHIYLAGDWVGPNGWLTDATLASARDAAKALLRESPAVLDSAAARSPEGSRLKLHV